MNKYLTSTLLAGLFITGATFSPATAQEQSLKPQGAWAITKVDRSTQGGNSYCTLSRKYDDGVVLSLGRNQTEEYSLAIDFQKDVFKKDKALKITLQPGPGQIRAYDMMPASEKAMVIRLGWDTGFFDTLNSSQQMKVKIADQNYTFAMPEITKGQADLADCMQDLKIAAKGSDKQPPTTDVLNAQIETSSGEFNAGRVDAKIPAAATIAAQKDQVEKQEKALLEGFAKSIRAQEPSLNDETPSASKNFAKTKESKEPNTAKAKMAEAAPSPKQEEIAAEKTPLELVKRPDAVSDKDKKELEQRLASLDKENNELKKKAAGSATEVQARFKELEGEKKALSEKLREAEMELRRKDTITQAANASIADNAKAEVAAMEKRLNDALAENATLATQLKSTQQQNQEKATLATAANNSADAAKAQIAALEKRVAEMTAEKASLDAKLKEAEKDASEKAAIASKASASSESVKAQIAAMEKRIADVDKENAALRQKAGAITPEALAQIDALEAEKKSLNEKLATVQKASEAKAAANIVEANDAAQKRVADLEAKIKVLEQENKKYAADVSQAASAAKLAAANITPMPSSASEEDMKILLQQLADVKEENAQLKKALPSASAGAPIAIAKLESENKALTDKVAALEKAGGTNTTKPEAIASLEAKLKETEIKNEQLEESLRNAQVRIAEAALNTESKSLKQIADLEAKLEASKKDNMRIAKELDDAKLKQEDKQLAMVSGDVTLASATKRYNEAEREIRRLGQQMDKQKEACNVEKAQIESMLFDPAVADQKQIERLAELEAEISALKSGRGGVSMASMGGDAALQQQIKSMQENLQGMKEANDEFNAQNEILRQETERLRMQLAEAQNNGASRADRVAVSNRRVEELERELALKEKQNQTYHNQLASIQKETRSNTGNDSFMEASAAEMNAILPSAGAVVAAKAVEKPAAYGKGNLEAMFKKAGLAAGGLKKSSSGMAGAENFNWSDNKVKGVASVKTIGNGNFTKMVDQYIADKKRACSGDFASMPSTSPTKGTKTMAMYEVACVGSSESVSSSLLFFEDQGRFIAISNDIDAADMDMAMDSRDKIASAVGGM